MSESTDEELMLAYKENSSQAFEILYRRYNKQLFSYIFSKVKDRQIAEDVFQRVFTKLHKSKSRYSVEIQFNKWLFTICKSELTDWYRSSAKDKLDFDHDQLANTMAPVTPEKTFDEIDVNGLNPEELRLLKYRYQADLDFHEIAERLSLSQATIRKRISRLIKKLQSKHGVQKHG